MTDDKVGRSQKLGAAIYARQVLDGHMAWMREHVRCGTCRWRKPWHQGFVGSRGDSLLACGNPESPWYQSPAEGRESCATHWEPQP